MVKKGRGSHIEVGSYGLNIFFYLSLQFFFIYFCNILLKQNPSVITHLSTPYDLLITPHVRVSFLGFSGKLSFTLGVVGDGKHWIKTYLESWPSIFFLTLRFFRGKKINASYFWQQEMWDDKLYNFSENFLSYQIQVT